MAAPESAYQAYNTKDRISSVLQKSYRYAKFLSAYSDVATAKSKFKLDGVLKEGTIGFTGYINLSTMNDAYHDPAQLGVVWHGKRLLADAGLNRKGDAQILNVLNTNTEDYNLSESYYPPRINNNRIFYWHESPLYNAIQSGTIQISANNINWTTIYNKSAMSEDSVAIGWIDNLSFIDVSGMFYLRATAVNAVGTYTSVVYQVNIRMIVDTMLFSASSASESVSGQSRTVYRNTRDLISYDNGANSNASSIYSDENSTPTQASTGYYYKSGYWYQYGYSTVLGRNCILASGQATPGGYPSGDPGNIVHTQEEKNYSGYDRDDLSTAEWEVNSGNYDYNTLYLDTVVDYDNSTTVVYAYSDSSHNTYARDGYYVSGNSIEGIESAIDVFNGIVTIIY